MKPVEGQFPNRTLLREVILKAFRNKTEWDRRLLIREVIKNCGFSDEELRDTGCESISSRLKSFSGIVINEMLADGTLISEEDVLNLPKKKKEFDKKKITDLFIKRYLLPSEIKDSTPSGKKNTLKSVLGDIFKKKEKEIGEAIDEIDYIDKQLRKNESVYRIIWEREKNYPDTPLGNRLKDVAAICMDCKKGILSEKEYYKEMQKALMECISLAGGEFFERLSLQLLKTCYGKSVVDEKLTAGPDDQGIDGVLTVKDPLEFVETIFFQSKTKRKEFGYIAIADVRGFLGVMTAYKATKGILISNSNFHKDTLRFAAKSDNLVLINKDKLFTLMTDYSVGVTFTDGLYRIDEDLFLK